MRNVDQRVGIPAPVLRVCTDELQAISVDPPSQTVPERVLDHTRQTVYRVLHQTGFIQDDPLSTIVPSVSEFL
jgi:hypothetical protein